MTVKEGLETIEVWHMMFEDDSYIETLQAVKSVINTCKFPPTIADIKDKLRLFTQTNEITTSQAWDLAYAGICNSGYHADLEFNKLPVAIQKAIGSANLMREYSQMDANIVASVIASGFRKSYEEISKREKALDKLPESVKQMLTNSVKKIGDGNE
jgi:hypothetical protein